MAKFNVSTYSQLEKVLQQAMYDSLEKVGEKTKDKAVDKIEEFVYSEPEGAYERTYGLRDSLKAFPMEKSGNEAVVRVAHDWFHMNYNVEKFQHASPYWSPWKYTRYVAETVHGGLSGSLFGYGHWNRPKPYMGSLIDDMSKGAYKDYMVDELRKLGLDAR